MNSDSPAVRAPAGKLAGDKSWLTDFVLLAALWGSSFLFMRISTLGKRGFIHVESWRLGWDGLQGGFCSKYREYLQENQRSRPPKPGDHEPR